MHFSNIDTEGWRQFDELSRIEGWLISDIERELFLTDLKTYAWQLTHDDQCCGFVTAVPYQRTGWIGNLIISPELRGRGYGSTLFDFAVEQLEAKGTSSIWLTASEDGFPLYSSRGFRVVDTVQRLRLIDDEKVLEYPDDLFTEESILLSEVDVEVWQENRTDLINSLSATCEVIAIGKSIAVLQSCGNFQMIGPWYTGDSDEQPILLQRLLEKTNRSNEIVIDVLSSSLLAPFLSENRFIETGSTKLMVKGEGFTPPNLGGFASLGSIG